MAKRVRYVDDGKDARRYYTIIERKKKKNAKSGGA